MGLWIALVVLLCAGGGSEGMSPRNEELIKVLPRAAAFFREKDIYKGDKLRMGLPKQPVKPFIERRVADAIPFSLAGLPSALKLLGIPQGSQMARDMRNSLTDCESPPPKEEQSFCANSLESLVDHATSLIGPHARAFETTATNRGNVYAHGQMQEYTITEVSFVSKSRSSSISCHPMSYAYAMFFCHNVYRTRLYKILLEGEDGTVVDALAACHLDSSYWSPRHTAFQVLRVKPGETEICHIIPEGHVVWHSED